MMVHANPVAGLRDLSARLGGAAAALIEPNGHVLAAELPNNSYPETFGVMCAAMIGAAAAAGGELGRQAPDRILVEGPDGRIVVVRCDDRTLLAVGFSFRQDRETALSEIAKFAAFFAGR